MTQVYKRSESAIQTSVKKRLEKNGWIVEKFRTFRNGHADLIAFRAGVTIFIETKRKGEKLRPLQEARRRQLQAAGFKFYSIDDPLILEI